MIRTLRIHALGPHATTVLDLDPMAWSVVEGPSEAGKSTLMDAVTLALWGQDRHGRPFPVEAIAGDRAEVELTLASGSTLKRTLKRKGRGQKRTLTPRGGEPVDYRREEDLAAALRVLGARSELCRLVMIPFAWQPLAEGPGGGRPLRDALSALMPASDIRGVIAELMGGDLRDGDSDTEEGAAAQRGQVRRNLDRAAGRAQARTEARQQLEADPPAPVDESAVEQARTVVARADAWHRHDDVMHDHRRVCDRTARVRESAERWDARRAELGDGPEEPGFSPAPEDVEAARAIIALDQAWLDHDVELHRHEADVADHETAVAALSEWQTRVKALGEPPKPPAETCTACGQALPPSDTDELAAWREQLDAIGAEPEVGPTPVPPAEPEGECPTPEQVRDARALAEQAAESEAAWKAYHAASAAHLRALRSLGQRPSAPAEPDAPEPPASERPEEQAIAEAERIIEEAQAAAAYASVHADSLTRAREQEAEAREQLVAIEAEHARCQRLVEACRQAPTIDLRRRMDAFGDLGPVGIVLGDARARGNAVDITFDGRPWWLASRGRQVVCDLHLRAALRHALGLRWLPLFVDDATAWTGAWPDIAGPVVLLETRPVDGLRVRAAREAA